MQHSAILNHSRGRSYIAPAAIYMATTQCEGSQGLQGGCLGEEGGGGRLCGGSGEGGEHAAFGQPQP